MNIDKRENKLYAFLIFLIWPFLSVLLAFNEYRASWAKNIIWAFTAFFAYSKVEPPGYYTDAIGYKMNFIHQFNNGTFSGLIETLTSLEKADLFEPIFSYLVSRFTGNAEIYYMLIGIIYGYFFSRNIWFFLERIGAKMKYADLIIIITLILIIPIWNIGGFRFWLASHVFLFGILNYFYKKDIKYLFYIGSAFLIHFSYAIPILIFVIYKVFGNKLNIYFIFFLASVFFQGILGADSLKDKASFLPEIYQNRVESYTNEEYIEKGLEINKKVNWYVSFQKDALVYSSYFLLIILFLKKDYKLKSQMELFSLFNFTLLFFGVANILRPFSSAARFLSPSSFLSIGIIFLFLQSTYYRKKMVRYISLISVFLIIFNIVSLRNGFDSFGLSTIFGNPLTALIFEEEQPLIDFIKSLLM